jgi:hypothetical protein
MRTAPFGRLATRRPACSCRGAQPINQRPFGPQAAPTGCALGCVEARALSPQSRKPNGPMQRCAVLCETRFTSFLAFPGGSKALWSQRKERQVPECFRHLLRSSAYLRGEDCWGYSPGWPQGLLRKLRAHFDKPPHPVTGCVLEVLVLLVTTLHQSGECVVVERVAAALLLRSPYIVSEAAAAIRALLLVFYTIVVKDASANQ